MQEIETKDAPSRVSRLALRSEYHRLGRTIALTTSNRVIEHHVCSPDSWHSSVDVVVGPGVDLGGHPIQEGSWYEAVY